MKSKIFFRKFNSIFVILFVLLAAVSLVFSVYAVEDGEDASESVPEATTAPTYAETTLPPQTYATTAATQATYQETTAPTTYYQESTAAPNYQQDVTTPSTAATEKSKATLPTIDFGDVEIPTAVGSGVEAEGISLVSGIIVWLCVAAGVAVIMAVIFSTKAKKKSGIGRYESGNKMDRHGRFSDEYYRR